MEVLSSLLRITMYILMFRAIFTIVTGIVMSKKMKQTQQSKAEINEKLEQKRIQQAERISRMVQDDYCGKMVDKENAYIVHVENQNYHFCSWDCRQRYIEEAS